MICSTKISHNEMAEMLPNMTLNNK